MLHTVASPLSAILKSLTWNGWDFNHSYHSQSKNESEVRVGFGKMDASITSSRDVKILGSFHEQILAVNHLAKWSRTKVVVGRHHDIAEVFLGQKILPEVSDVEQLNPCWNISLTFWNIRPFWVVMAHLTSKVVPFHGNWVCKPNNCSRPCEVSQCESFIFPM